ncbi:alpha/beta hydrolase [Streptomyces sp. NPDC021622]|uniref:alpha/beta fold hydrolase n=1 Tax=Streptomyces sp. NPDC021622 TaxID=3155013 RepID=UPI00340A9D63
MRSFVGIGGVRHHVEVAGRGPVCVLSAGLGLVSADWDAVAELLSPWRTVVRFDRPGLGLSGHARVPSSLAGEAGRIAGLLDALEFPGPVTVVGHSLAGFHGEAFARLYPERTAGLVLVDSSIEERPGHVRVPRVVRVGGARVGGAVLRGVGVSRAVGPVGVRRFLVQGALLEYATYGDVARELAALRGEFPLPEGVPVTVLAAYARGSMRWLYRQRGLAATLGATFRVAEPSGHLVMRDSPEDVAEAVLAVRPA